MQSFILVAPTNPDWNQSHIILHTTQISWNKEPLPPRPSCAIKQQKG